jgi:hypothetical protein
MSEREILRAACLDISFYIKTFPRNKETLFTNKFPGKLSYFFNYLEYIDTVPIFKPAYGQFAYG